MIHDPLSRPPSTRSSRSHSHLTTTSSPPHPAITTDRPRALSASSAASSSAAVAAQRHTYHHLRQHEGMQPLPLDYPLHEYSSLGPRPTTPPLRPPKPSHLRNIHEEEVRGPNSEFSSRDAPAMGPSWGSAVETSHHHQNITSNNHDTTNTHISTQQIKYDFGGDECTNNDDVFTQRSIYNTMSEDTKLTNGHLVVGSNEEQLNPTMDGVRHNHHISEHPPSKPDYSDRDYDKLASASHQHHSRKQQKSNVKIMDNSQPHAGSISSHGDTDPINKARLPSVKVTDPRYAGQYERHPDYISPQVEIPRDQLQAKYRGDYERDSTYFSRNPTRSFSVSTTSTHNVMPPKKQQERSFSLSTSLADKYRGDYERSGDYFIPPPLPHENGIKTDDYVLEPDPNYTGAYERHPNYVPPLVKRSSKTKIHILSPPTSTTATANTAGGGGGGGHNSEHYPASVPHEYTALATVTKNPPQQYTTLNSDTPVSTLQKDTAV